MRLQVKDANRVIWHSRDDRYGLQSIRRRESIESSLEELGRSGPHNNVSVLNHCITNQAMQTSYLFGKFWLEEPTKVGNIREVAHCLPSWDDNCRFFSVGSPKRLKHCRISTAVQCNAMQQKTHIHKHNNSSPFITTTANNTAAAI